MANVYLQLPTYHAAFVRNSFDPPLQKGEPLVYSDFSIETSWMKNGLLPVSGHKEKVPLSYSQAEWQNMMHGKRPDGGPVIRKRDVNEYLTYSEIRDLSGFTLSGKSENFEYLCVRMPNIVFIDGKQCRTNAVYNLDHHTALMLRQQISHNFICRLRTFLICTHNFNIMPSRDGQTYIKQSIVNTIERFLMCYDIPISMDYVEFRTIRKMVQRHVPKEALSLCLTDKEKEFASFPDSADKKIRFSDADCNEMLNVELIKLKNRNN